ncbi:MAG: CBS domain-containing protein [Chloroflexota bacterium]|nr:CBS domain-containing protein [Chloroflexota bacterium]
MKFFYLSQVLGQPVRTSGGDRLARIKDLVAQLEALNAKGEGTREPYPPISGLVVEVAKRDIFIPWSQVASLGGEGARLSSATISLLRFDRREGEVLLARDIFDKQLIDIDGRRVIRANDLQLYQSEGMVRVTAVDVSIEAILRRLAFGRIFTAPQPVMVPPDNATASSELPRINRRRAAPAKLINWGDVEPLAGDVPEVRLRLSHERLALLNPVDIAHILEDLSYHQGADIIEGLDDETAAETLEAMAEERQADIVESLDHERAADILEEMDPSDAADLLADLDEEQAEELLRRMNPEDAEDVEELLAYPEDSAGGIMTSDFLTVPPRLTIDETLAFIRSLQDAPDLIDYLYVIEEADPGQDWSEMQSQEGGKLQGIVTLRDLLMSQGERCLSDIMVTDFLWVDADDSSDKAARLMAEYNLIALPVLDEQERMLGVITVDDAMEVLLPERWLDRLPRIFT